MAAVEELKKDVEELRLLLEQANRPKVKDLLSIDIRKLETEIIHKLEQQKAENMEMDGLKETSSSSNVLPTKLPVPQARYTVDVKEYAWDQSDKFMKIYATIEGVESVSEENITCDFTNRSFKLSVKDVKNKDYQVHVSNLFEDIVPKDSYFRVKTNTVLIMLKKRTGKTWAYVTEKESKAKDTKKPKYDENKDPSDSLMDLMKQMYDDGDDEMKRTIQKAWVESREKQGHGV